MAKGLDKQFRFGDSSINEMLLMIGLTAPESHSCAEQLQNRVIQPNIDGIMDEFYAALVHNDEFLRTVKAHSGRSRLKMTQRNYLLTLGYEFDKPHYFEDRLKVGAVHRMVGVSLVLYQSFYCYLQTILINNIPDELRSDPEAFSQLVQFIIRITSLDLALAIDSYHLDTVARLESSIREQHGTEQRLRRSLRTDSLTGLFSRRYALGLLRNLITNQAAPAGNVCVVMADVDRFKQINDSHGHLVGDNVLRGIAKRMSHCCRSKDIVGRFGGEEFIMVLDDTAIEEALCLANRIRTNVKKSPIQYDGREYSVTLSLGVASLNEDDTPESLTARADNALYFAKRDGRDKVRSELDFTDYREAMAARVSEN